jgi:membrane protein YqaA with SNARE-associated domain
MEETAPERPVKTGALAWLRKRMAAVAGLLLALVVIGGVGFVYLRYPDFFKNLQSYADRGALIGYGATFVISLVLNATVIIPVSNMTIIAGMGAILPLPWLVGIAGGVGAGIGEMTGYLVGRSGRDLLAKNKMYVRVEGWVKRWGWLAVFIMSIVPFAFDVVGIIAGALRMPVWRFFLACWLGRTIAYITVACLSAWGLDQIIHVFG